MTVKKQTKESKKRKLSHSDGPSEDEVSFSSGKQTLPQESEVLSAKRLKVHKTKKEKSNSEITPVKSAIVAEDDSGDETQQTPITPQSGKKNKKKNSEAKFFDVAATPKSQQTPITPQSGKKNKNKNSEATFFDVTATPKSKSGAVSSGPSDDKERINERDRKTLFIKNLPGNCSIRLIKAISEDVQHVRLRKNLTKGKKEHTRAGFAYVEFASEALAEKNHGIFSKTTIKGRKLVVDYVGTKSGFQIKKQKTEPEELDSKRLYVSGLPGSATNEELRQFFPDATDILLPRKKKDKSLFGYGFVGFDSAKQAKEYHDKSQGLVLKGSKLCVLYAKVQKPKESQTETQEQSSSPKKQKKAKGKANKKTAAKQDNQKPKKTAEPKVEEASMDEDSAADDDDE